MLHLSRWLAAAAFCALLGPADPVTFTGPPLATHKPYAPPAPAHALEYCVITTAALADAWRPLAAEYTELGVPADVVTVEQILANPEWAGSDVTESIRKFVETAHARWGLRWLLLGGDVDLVPGRYLILDMLKKKGKLPFISDSYYACLGTDWNRDRDAQWGEEAIDGKQFDAKLFVGRVTAQTVRDVEAWLAKRTAYVHPKHRDYQTRALFIGADVFKEGDAEAHYDALAAARFTPAGFTHEKLMPSNDGSNEQRAIAELTKGYGVVSHYEHSFKYNVGLHKGAISLGNYKQIANAERPSVMWSSGCNVCQFDYQSISEALLLSDAGGVVAIIGSSETNFSLALEYEKRFWTAVFEGKLPLGQALALVKGGIAKANRGDHFEFLSASISLLGDPAMRLWRAKPRDLKVKVAEGAVVVQDGTGAPVAGATVCLSAERFYARGTTGKDGRWKFEAPEGGANAVLGVAADGAVPHRSEVKLASGTAKPAPATAAAAPKPAQPYRMILAWDAATRRGRVRVVNATATAGDVTVTLTAEGLTAGASAEGEHSFTLPAGGGTTVQAEATGPAGTVTRSFDCAAPPAPPDGLAAEPDVTRIRLTWTAPALVGAGRPAPDAPAGWVVYRERDGTSVRLTPKPVWHAVFVDDGLPGLTEFRYRVATVSAAGLEGVPSEPLVVSTALPRLPDWPKRTGAPMGDVVLADLNNDRKPELLAGDEGLGLWVWRNDGSEWRHGGDNWTFGLFKQIEGGVHTPVVADIDGDRRMEIITCGRLKDRNVYVWDLKGRDKKGWPQQLSSRPMTSPRAVDLDGDGRLEIVCIDGFGKRIFAWKADGTPFREGAKDAVLCTIGQFNYFLGPIADVTGDGRYEICVMDGSGKLQAITDEGKPAPGFPLDLGGPGRAALLLGDVDGDKKPDLVTLAKGGSVLTAHSLKGTPLKGFPVQLCEKNENHSFSHPALAQLDDDKGLEIVVGNHSKQLWIIEGDGTIRAGWPKQLPGIAASIAVGDIDGDGAQEIVAASTAQIVHGFELDGTVVRGFPLRTGGENRGVPFLGDFNGDKKLDLLLGSRDGWVYAWSLDVPLDNTALQWSGQSNGHGFPAEWRPRKAKDEVWKITKPKRRRVKRRPKPKPAKKPKKK
ncbi:MAG: C25 family cysteine peptidase [Planctomycetota bacterium]|jgi:hypothetical protein